MPALPTRRILGVDFFIGTLDAAVELALASDPVVRQSGTPAIQNSGGPATSLRDARLSGLPELRPSGPPVVRLSGLPALPAPSSPLERSPAPGSSAQTPSTPNSQLSTSAQRSTLVVAPSAPGLAVDLVRSPSYRHALQTADLVLTDSGFMVLLWRLFTGERLPRHSGLKFLRAVLARPELKQPGAIFWVMPSAEEDARNQAWLKAQGFPITPDDSYIAPVYPATGELTDVALVARLEARRPQVVMLAIGGGVQERLGLFLRASLETRSPPVSALSSQLSAHSPTIMCLGAAIAFLTGGQTSIPPWADKLVLGWLLRLLSNPRKFWRRDWEALRLAPLLWRWRERAPGAR